MDTHCDSCKASLQDGGITFTPPGEGKTSQHLCMTCFEAMSGPDIKAEQAV